MVRMVTETTPAEAAKRSVGRHALRPALLALVCAFLSGCGTLYVMQAANGQYHVLRSRVPIDEVIADPHTPPDLRTTLTQVKAAREFASHELGLPDNKSYRSYADIGRPFAVWNV